MHGGMDTLFAWLHVILVSSVLLVFSLTAWTLKLAYALLPWPVGYVLDVLWLRSHLLRRVFAYRLGVDAWDHDEGAGGSSTGGGRRRRGSSTTLAEDAGHAQRSSEKQHRTACCMIQEAGYECEEHTVVTGDGYVLAMQRVVVPGGAGAVQHTMGMQGGSRLRAAVRRKLHAVQLSALSARLGLDSPNPSSLPPTSLSPPATVADGMGGGIRTLPPPPQHVPTLFSHLPNTGRPPVLLLHGLMQSSDAFLAPGLIPRHTDGARVTLPYMLANAGYDVWLGNARGNRYSCAHLYHSPESSRFWDFSIDHMARQDLPALVKYIKEYTGYNRVAFVGFSQGTATMFAALASQPSLSSSLSVFAALSPAMALRGLARSPVSTLLKHEVEFLYTLFGHKRMLGVALDIQRMVSPSLYATLIDGALAYLFGWRQAALDPLLKPILYAHLYSFTSVQTVVHWFSIIRDGRFSMNVGGSQAGRPRSAWEWARRIMSSLLPLPFLSTATRVRHRVVPLYDTRHISIPIGVWIGGKDTLIDPARLMALLPPLSGPIPIPLSQAGHVLHQPGPGLPPITVDTRDLGHASARQAVERAGGMTEESRRPALHVDATVEQHGHVGIHPSPTLHERTLDAIAAWVKGVGGKDTPSATATGTPGSVEGSSIEQDLAGVPLLPGHQHSSPPSTLTLCDASPTAARAAMHAGTLPSTHSTTSASGCTPGYVLERHPPFVFVEPSFEHLDYQWATPTVDGAAWPAVVAFLDRYKHTQVQVAVPLAAGLAADSHALLVTHPTTSAAPALAGSQHGQGHRRGGRESAHAGTDAPHTTTFALDPTLEACEPPSLDMGGLVPDEVSNLVGGQHGKGVQLSAGHTIHPSTAVPDLHSLRHGSWHMGEDGRLASNAHAHAHARPHALAQALACRSGSSDMAASDSSLHTHEDVQGMPAPLKLPKDATSPISLPSPPQPHLRPPAHADVSVAKLPSTTAHGHGKRRGRGNRVHALTYTSTSRTSLGSTCSTSDVESEGGGGGGSMWKESSPHIGLALQTGIGTIPEGIEAPVTPVLLVTETRAEGGSAGLGKGMCRGERGQGCEGDDEQQYKPPGALLHGSQIHTQLSPLVPAGRGAVQVRAINSHSHSHRGQGFLPPATTTSTTGSTTGTGTGTSAR